jgi:N-succinyldiaminopimelate aminotransferase
VLPGRLAELPAGSFARLTTLLAGVSPGAPIVDLAVGDPRGEVPSFVIEAIARHAHQFGEYPPIQGTAEWRAAAAGWLKRRFALPHAANDLERHLLPLSGTREGLFLAPFVVTPHIKADSRPTVLIPNPFYPCYAAAALAAGAEPVFVTANERSGFLPDFASVPEDVLARAAAAYVCSPSNPEGVCADEQYWRTLFVLADRHRFTVFADECYADVYLTSPPASALAVRLAASSGFERLLTFHSLSKRSSLPGLRSGIVAGDGEVIAKLRYLRNVVGPQIPMPLQAASAAAWRDEAHVAANREIHAGRVRLAQQVLGHHAGFRVPEGGFFLWLDVGDGEKTTVRLWREAGIRVLPGAYMGRETEPGNRSSNPGFRYIRVALVHGLSTMEDALRRMSEILGSEPA